MARKSSSPETERLDDAFEAISLLTHREMANFAELLVMQGEGRDMTDPRQLADCLADAAESHFTSEDEE